MSELQEKWDDPFDRIAEAIEVLRQEHPEATLAEIEEAVVMRVAEVRTQMVEDLAHQGRTTGLTQIAEEARLPCPQCGVPSSPTGSRSDGLLQTTNRLGRVAGAVRGLLGENADHSGVRGPTK